MMAKRGRRRGSYSSKARLVKYVVEDYLNKYPGFEGLVEAYVPLKGDKSSEYDLVLVDKARSELVGVRVCRVMEGAPSADTLGFPVNKVRAELRLYRGKQCVCVLRGSEMDCCVCGGSASERIKEKVVELMDLLVAALKEEVVGEEE